MNMPTAGWLISTYKFLIDHKISVVFLFFLLLPFLLAGDFTLSAYVLIFAIFAMGYNLVLGETGMLTFGHAAFFGLGAYGSGMFLVHINPPPWLGLVSLLAGVLLATIGGAVIGALSLRRRGTYLALITLAFAQMIYFLVFQLDDWTGGDDGLFGIQTPEIGIPGLFNISFVEGVGPISGLELFYLFILCIFVLTWISLRHIKRSNFGRTLNAIRENEDRARFLGFNVHRYRLTSFILSAAVSGLAGALYAPYFKYVGLDTLEWILSGEVNFWVLLGGIGSFIGAAIGTMVYFIADDTLSRLTTYSQLFMGVLLIVIVLYFPEGIIGTMKERIHEHNQIDDRQRRVPNETETETQPKEGK